MKVYNETKTQVLNEYDLNKGYLIEDTLITHFDEIQAVKEQGHYETIAEYDNGGKDVKWVVDVDGVEYQEPKDIVEKVLVYIPYTDEELQIKSATQELNNIKAWFIENDWKVNKIVIGEWTTDDQRWLDYLSERAVKRVRQDELIDLLK